MLIDSCEGLDVDGTTGTDAHWYLATDVVVINGLAFRQKELIELRKSKMVSINRAKHLLMGDRNVVLSASHSNRPPRKASCNATRHRLLDSML